MKNHKILSLLLILGLATTSIFAQGSKEQSNVKKIGISKLLPHPALDAVEQGIQDHLSTTNLEVEYNLQNANGDISTAASIAQQLKSDNCDLVVGIATPSAQSLANVFREIPVVFSAVTDPISASLEGGNLCGVSDLNPVSAQKMDLLNYIDLSSYLLSVIPSEMPASWPIEALKAQSVVARSYILRNINRHKNEDYDLCATVHCIVYSGAQNEHTSTTEAIIATRNEIITHNGNIIDAVFSSNSGGYTEASENVWINSLDYLKAVNTTKNDNYNFPLKPFEIENWFVEKPASYSNNKYTTQSSYRWVKNINLERLKDRHALEDIKRVYITDRTTTGTVKEIKIEGRNKTVTKNNSAIRRALTGLKSNKFIVKNIYNQNELKSIIIFGAGWGHSVGMDQSAAAGMAVEGKKYKEIINFFYPDTKITKLE